MKLSEARIRSIIRSKLLEALTVDQKTAGSVDPTISKEDLSRFLDKLTDGSVIKMGGLTSLEKKDGKFTDVGEGVPGSREYTSSFNSLQAAKMILSHAVEGQSRDIESIEIFDANKQKVFAKSNAAQTASGSEINPEKTFMPTNWLKRVTARPLQFGSKGPDVGVLQDFLKTALLKMIYTTGGTSEKQVDLSETSQEEIKSLIRSGSVKSPKNIKNPSARDLVEALQESIKTDNDFGPITKAAVIVVQHGNEFNRGLSPDGKVGKNTAEVLLKYVNRS